ncbi:MAG: hypothetical protein ABID04_01710 [Patescibacteria group bacterium]
MFAWLGRLLLFLFIIQTSLLAAYFSKFSRGKVLSSVDSVSVCPLACQELIDQRVAVALAGKTSKVASLAYVPLGDGGSTILRDWTVIDGSEFSFNLADYSSSAKVYWEGNLKARDSNSRCYARLYDLDNFREVDFSQQSTDQTGFQTLTSQALRIWRGNNHYRLEIKSLNGVACYLETPRLVVRY